MAETVAETVAEGTRPKRSRPLSVHRFRWVFQLFFLLVFLALLTMTFWPVATGLVAGFLLADPLIALNSAARGLFRWEMLLAIPVLLSPLLLGRAFCGYVCPMGFLVELVGPRKDRHLGERARTVMRKVPLFGLIVVVMFILMGSAWFLVMDPISLLTRSTTTLLYPAVDRVLTWVGDLFYRADSLQGTVDSVTNVLTGRLIFPDGLYFALQILILVMFLVVLGISWLERRLWCRDLCPLGALLGLVGRGALFGRVVDQTACTSCKACVKACPMDAIRDDGRSTDMSRCECGLECADACRQGAIGWGYKPRKTYEYDPDRRALLIGAGVALVATFGVLTGVRRIWPPDAAAEAAEGATTTTVAAPAGASGEAAAGAAGVEGAALATTNARALPIRPPGAKTEVEFLASCTRCGQCLKVCPTNVLQPAALEAGLEGLFTPRMDFTRSYCEWTCADCGVVCPTQSIAPLAVAAKQETVIGLAVIDRSICLPWAKGEECLVCEELCPTPEKAITFGAGGGGGGVHGGGGQGRGRGAGVGSEGTEGTEGEAEAAAAATGVKLPRVRAPHCIGCGICQYNCPVQGPAAIVVYAVEHTTVATEEG